MKKKTSFLFASFLSFLILFTILQEIPVFALSDWNTQVINEKGARMGYGGILPIVIDTNNYPHIAYSSPAYDTKVMYSSWNGSNWNTQKVGDGLVFSLVLDSNNRPHILFNGLRYAVWTGTNWLIELIDSSVPNGIGVLALDSLNQPHAVYTDGRYLKYANWTDNLNINIQIIENYSETQYGIPSQVSLAFDSNNTPYIFYKSDCLKLATYNNLSWNIVKVADNGTIGNLALDSKGYPHVIYQESTIVADRLVYASWNGVNWNRQTVVLNASFSSSGFLALDHNDQPAICIVTYTLENETGGQNTQLLYTKLSYDTWNTQMINVSIPPLGPCYLAIDSNNNPHMSYLGLNKDAGFGLVHEPAYVMYSTTNETLSSISSTTSWPGFIQCAAGIALIIFIIIAVFVIFYAKKLVFFKNKEL
ncbi:MAG: hypothetical protein ACQCN5_03895 [Candidatus Bathyarchaeia archaeon]|jgi:hypothetical protein